MQERDGQWIGIPIPVTGLGTVAQDQLHRQVARFHQARRQACLSLLHSGAGPEANRILAAIVANPTLRDEATLWAKQLLSGSGALLAWYRHTLDALPAAPLWQAERTFYRSLRPATAIDRPGTDSRAWSWHRRHGLALRPWLGDLAEGLTLQIPDRMKPFLQDGRQPHLGQWLFWDQAWVIHLFWPMQAPESRTVPFVAAALLVPPLLLPASHGYRVQKGDTLWRIASQTLGRGPQWQALYAANRQQIAHPHWIFPGQWLTLPTPGNGGRLVVRPGDTLWGLAQRHTGHGSWWPALWQANRDRLARPGQLMIGMALRWPASWQIQTAPEATVTPGPSTLKAVLRQRPVARPAPEARPLPSTPPPIRLLVPGKPPPVPGAAVKADSDTLQPIPEPVAIALPTEPIGPLVLPPTEAPPLATPLTPAQPVVLPPERPPISEPTASDGDALNGRRSERSLPPPPLGSPRRGNQDSALDSGPGGMAPPGQDDPPVSSRSGGPSDEPPDLQLVPEIEPPASDALASTPVVEPTGLGDSLPPASEAPAMAVIEPAGSDSSATIDVDDAVVLPPSPPEPDAVVAIQPAEGGIDPWRHWLQPETAEPARPAAMQPAVAVIQPLVGPRSLWPRIGYGAVPEYVTESAKGQAPLQGWVVNRQRLVADWEWGAWVVRGRWTFGHTEMLDGTQRLSRQESWADVDFGQQWSPVSGLQLGLLARGTWWQRRGGSSGAPTLRTADLASFGLGPVGMVEWLVFPGHALVAEAAVLPLMGVTFSGPVHVSGQVGQVEGHLGWKGRFGLWRPHLGYRGRWLYDADGAFGQVAHGVMAGVSVGWPALDEAAEHPTW